MSQTDRLVISETASYSTRPSVMSNETSTRPAVRVRSAARFPNFTISTDIIVGFPSETEEDFQKTIQLLDETKPDVVNLSKYSARPGTDAAELKQISGFLFMLLRFRITFGFSFELANQGHASRAILVVRYCEPLWRWHCRRRLGDGLARRRARH